MMETTIQSIAGQFEHRDNSVRRGSRPPIATIMRNLASLGLLVIGASCYPAKAHADQCAVQGLSRQDIEDAGTEGFDATFRSFYPHIARRKGDTLIITGSDGKESHFQNGIQNFAEGECGYFSILSYNEAHKFLIIYYSPMAGDTLLFYGIILGEGISSSAGWIIGPKYTISPDGQWIVFIGGSLGSPYESLAVYKVRDGIAESNLVAELSFYTYHSYVKDLEIKGWEKENDLVIKMTATPHVPSDCFTAVTQCDEAPETMTYRLTLPPKKISLTKE